MTETKIMNINQTEKIKLQLQNQVKKSSDFASHPLTHRSD